MDVNAELNEILADWDPVGMKLAGPLWPKSEYLIHLERLINFYKEQGSVESYLLKYFPPSSVPEHEAFNIALIQINSLLEKNV
ncbi:MAG: hypothetical protein IPI31_16950 [Bacteroidetes bacterium]|nr:hypothetical protein [Bacteroidota bacterium]